MRFKIKFVTIAVNYNYYDKVILTTKTLIYS